MPAVFNLGNRTYLIEVTPLGKVQRKRTGNSAA